MPRRTTHQIMNLKGHVYTSSTDWRENVVNQPVAAEEFSLLKMELRRGDRIDDQRTGTMTRIVDEAFPPPEVEEKTNR